MAQRSEPRRLRVTPRLGTNERNLPADPWPTSPPLPLLKTLPLRSPLPLPRLKNLRSPSTQMEVVLLYIPMASFASSEIVGVLPLAASGMMVVIPFAASEMVVVLLYIADWA